MKKSETKVSKFFVPANTQRFTMTKHADLKCSFESEEREIKVEIEHAFIPFGVIDAWKLNDSYKILLHQMNINNFENNDAIKLIMNQINKYEMNKADWLDIDPYIWKAEDDENVCEPQATEEYIKVMYLWRSTRLPISSIAFKVGI